jgi:hypothetical protein
MMSPANLMQSLKLAMYTNYNFKAGLAYVGLLDHTTIPASDFKSETPRRRVSCRSRRRTTHKATHPDGHTQTYSMDAITISVSTLPPALRSAHKSAAPNAASEPIRFSTRNVG